MLARVGIGGGEHRATLLVAEEIRAGSEITGQLCLEHAPGLVDKGVVGIEDHETSNMSGIVDFGACASDIDSELRASRDSAGVDDLGACEARGKDTCVAAIDRPRIDDTNGAVGTGRSRKNPGGFTETSRREVSAVLNGNATVGAIGM